MYEISDMSSQVQELTWALVDKQATEDQVRHLEELLLEDHEARQVYVKCMQMHADLHYMLSGKKPVLPPAVEKAIEAQKKSSLSIDSLPPVVANVPCVEGLARS